LGRKVIIIGPAYPLRGGLASFDHRLTREFIRSGFDTSIYSFSLQYPSFLFPGKTQYSTEEPPEGLIIHSRINSINPLNWYSVGAELKKANADIIVVRYWLPFMAPSLGTILRKAAGNHHTKIIAITDNILPHEKRPGDRAFTRYFLNACDAYVTMSKEVTDDLKTFEKRKPVKQVVHPHYDNFGIPLSKEEARQWLRKEKKMKLADEDKLILFFGFIRKYKGLDILLRAMTDKRIQQSQIRLLVAGEFYESEKPYLDLISDLKIEGSLILKTDFIPDQEVRFYLSAADAVIQPYRHATQSGVTPLAYFFEKPMIVSNVGGLPDLVPNGKAGIVVSPDQASLADAIIRFYELGENSFIPHLRSEKEKYSWKRMVESIISLADDIQK
jgi:glycosyltransferase involved in cell wall biosynthesis